MIKQISENYFSFTSTFQVPNGALRLCLVSTFYKALSKKKNVVMKMILMFGLQ